MRGWLQMTAAATPRLMKLVDVWSRRGRHALASGASTTPSLVCVVGAGWVCKQDRIAIVSMMLLAMWVAQSCKSIQNRHQRHRHQQHQQCCQ